MGMIQTTTANDNKLDLTLLNKTILPSQPWIAIRGFKGDLHNSKLMACEWVKWAMSGKNREIRIELQGPVAVVFGESTEPEIVTPSNCEEIVPTIDKDHICNPESCPDTGGYYISAIDAGDNYLMAGPYQTHQEAIDDRDKALEIAYKHDASGRAWFMAWGTCRIDGSTKLGRLNQLGLMEAE